jgi:hypothetical protein
MTACCHEDYEVAKKKLRHPNSQFQLQSPPLPWNFYSWFVFAAVFIAAYFAWVWTSARRVERGSTTADAEDAEVES